MQRTLKRRKLAASLKELAEQGIPVDVSVADVEDESADLEIEQAGSVYDSKVFELSNGLTGYMLDLYITNQTWKKIYCRDLELRLAWEDSRFDWMLDPREEEEFELYRFPGKNSLELPADQVINHVLLAEKGLKPKRPLRGWLLATGGPMPQNLRHGQWIEPTLTIATSDHVGHTATIRLWVERLEHRPKSETRKGELFEQPIGPEPNRSFAAPTHQPALNNQRF